MIVQLYIVPIVAHNKQSQCTYLTLADPCNKQDGDKGKPGEKK